MKNFKYTLKTLFLFLIISISVFSFTACEIVVVKQDNSNTNTTPPTTSSPPSIENTYSLYEAYQDAIDNEEFSGTFLEFLKEILATEPTYTTAVAHKMVASSVMISAYNQGDSSGASGSGVIYNLDESGNAYIITNYHVVYNESTHSINNTFKIKLYLGDSFSSINATYVGGTSQYDIAVLKITESSVLKNSNAQSIHFYNKDIIVGEPCIAVGNAAGKGIAVSAGVVSVDSEYATLSIANNTTQHRLIRHDAFITNGNSGGGLFDYDGNVIGINCGGAEEDIHYAIPSTVVKKLVDSIITNSQNSNKQPSSLLLGISTTSYANTTYYNPATGLIEIIQDVEIVSISDGLIKSHNILKSKDVLEKVEIVKDGETKTIFITREWHMRECLIGLEPETTVKIYVLRDTETIIDTIEVTSENLVNIN